VKKEKEEIVYEEDYLDDVGKDDDDEEKEEKEDEKEYVEGRGRKRKAGGAGGCEWSISPSYIECADYVSSSPEEEEVNLGPCRAERMPRFYPSLRVDNALWISYPQRPTVYQAIQSRSQNVRNRAYVWCMYKVKNP